MGVRWRTFYWKYVQTLKLYIYFYPINIKTLNLYVYFSSFFINRWGGLLSGRRGPRLLVPVYPEQRQTDSRWNTRARPDPGNSDDEFGPRRYVDIHTGRVLVGGRSYREVWNRQAHTQHGHRRFFVWTLRLLDEWSFQECKHRINMSKIYRRYNEDPRYFFSVDSLQSLYNFLL